MTKYRTNNFSIINLYKKPSKKSEIVTQMIYGDSFSITKKTKKWLKVKVKEDNYIGYIANKNYSQYLKPSHKIAILRAKVYKFPNKRNEIIKLTFGSKIKVLDKKANFLKFEEGWISSKDVKPFSYKEKNLFNKINIFKNTKYKWGGKSFKGIDCSALVQVFLNFNKKSCPRDAKDQVKYFRKILHSKKSKKMILFFGKVTLQLPYQIKN